MENKNQNRNQDKEDSKTDQQRLGPLDINDSLAFNITRVGLLLRRELVQALSDFSMTPEQWQIMMTLRSKSEPISQKEIAAAIFKDKHALSKMIAKLEKNHWVVKKASKTDRRATLISLTDKGEAACAKMHLTLSAHIKTKLFNHFETNEKEQVKKVMKEMRHLLGDTIK